ncbi:hypothetical protein GWI34_00910 [Actinomadura sp. DSM 109109]|nr:hypothetical protein [Actinomadura lepetitiana]
MRTGGRAEVRLVLLDSQFTDLEAPEPDDHIVTAPITGTPEGAFAGR